MSLPAPILFDKDKHAHLICQICEIHKACIILDHQILAFLPSPTGDVNTAALWSFWEIQCAQDDGPSTKKVLLQMDHGYEKVLGVVVLDMPFAETGPFRCWVQKLMVSPDSRRQGIARSLLKYVEDVAVTNNKYLLMLDVPVGSPAEQSRMYEQAGYVEVGTIPRFSIDPKDGSLVDEKFFYKDLRTSQFYPEAIGPTASIPHGSNHETG